MEDMVNNGAPPAFVDFVSKKCRAYLISDSPLETPTTGRETFGCNCYASGEDSYQENGIVKSWRSMLDWFNLLHANPAHEEIEFVFVDKEGDEETNIGWPTQRSEAWKVNEATAGD